MDTRLAIVTGASSGIGYELAAACAREGFDLLIAADRSEIHDAARQFRALGVRVDALEVDLANLQGVDRLYETARGRPVDALVANAGHGLGHAFLDQPFEGARHVIDTNITGTIYLIQRVARDMRVRGEGRILITGSVAGFVPGTFHAVDFADAGPSFATDAPRGFDDDHIALLGEILPALALVSEIRLKNQLARTLLETYIGFHASEKILDGATTRGTGWPI